MKSPERKPAILADRKPKIIQTKYGPAVPLAVELPLEIWNYFDRVARERITSRGAIVREVLTNHVKAAST